MAPKPVTDLIARQAAEVGFHKVFERHPPRVFWRVACSHCGTASDHNWKRDAPPAIMIKAMKIRGWRIGKHLKPVCSSCDVPARTPSARKQSVDGRAAN